MAGRPRSPLIRGEVKVSQSYHEIIRSWRIMSNLYKPKKICDGAFLLYLQKSVTSGDSQATHGLQMEQLSCPWLREERGGLAENRFDPFFLFCSRQPQSLSGKSATLLWGGGWTLGGFQIWTDFRSPTIVEIGDLFGFTYTAVSHIVKEVKGQLQTDRDYGQKYRLFNSQIKM